MRRRVVQVVAFTAVIAAVAVGCTSSPTVPPGELPYGGTPEYCPYDDLVVQSNGDSIGVGYTNMLRLPAQYSLFNAAQGAATFTLSFSVPLISERVQQWIEQCGNPGVVVIEGGIIDLTYGVPLEAIQAAVTQLSDWLEARGVPTVWLGIHPFPKVSPYMAHNANRQAYNEWLTTPGNVWGAAVDCTPVLEDPANPGTMNPAYWKIVDLFGSPDGLHPNTAGYTTMAECVKPLILDALTTA
jgi:lysophospholipase L1-like esterase